MKYHNIFLNSFGFCWRLYVTDLGTSGWPEKRARLVTKAEQGPAPRVACSESAESFDLAYERIEDLIITCELRPGCCCRFRI